MERNDRIAVALRDGASMAAIARSLGLTRERVRQIRLALEADGVDTTPRAQPPPPMPPPPVPAPRRMTARDGEVLALLRQGRTGNEIAAQLSLSRQRVSQIRGRLRSVYGEDV